MLHSQLLREAESALRSKEKVNKLMNPRRLSMCNRFDHVQQYGDARGWDETLCTYFVAAPCVSTIRAASYDFYGRNVVLDGCFDAFIFCMQVSLLAALT